MTSKEYLRVDIYEEDRRLLSGTILNYGRKGSQQELFVQKNFSNIYTLLITSYGHYGVQINVPHGREGAVHTITECFPDDDNGRWQNKLENLITKRKVCVYVDDSNIADKAVISVRGFKYKSFCNCCCIVLNCRRKYSSPINILLLKRQDKALKVVRQQPQIRATNVLPQKSIEYSIVEEDDLNLPDPPPLSEDEGEENST